MNVEELMTKPVETINLNDTLDIAASKMWDSDCGVLPVVGPETHDRLVSCSSYANTRDTAFARSTMAARSAISRAASPASSPF